MSEAVQAAARASHKCPGKVTVSAIIPAYNRREYLPRAIHSVLVQTVPVDEIVLVDDGSTDGSAELVQSRYGNRVRVVRQCNSGVSGARRRGIQEARGEWIAFLDSDDEWLPRRNEDFLKAIQCIPNEVGWIFGALRIVTDDGEGPTEFEKHGLSINGSPHVFADSIAIQYPYQFSLLPASLIRRNVLLELDCFSEGLRHSEDVLAGFQVACRYTFAAIPSVVGRYYRTSDLEMNSLWLNGNLGPDYFRSRVLAFERVIKMGRRWPWNFRYAQSSRALCQVLARQGIYQRNLAWQQFRYGGISPKAVAFLFAALMGPAGLRLWAKHSRFAKWLQVPKPPLAEPSGPEKYFPSVCEKNA